MKTHDAAIYNRAASLLIGESKYRLDIHFKLFLSKIDVNIESYFSL